MASLKEVKRRIISVEGTKKITVARQMIASALLHKTQEMLVYAENYKQEIDKLYSKLSPDDSSKHKTGNHGEDKTGIILISSNSGMCGPFNMNITKEVSRINEEYAGKELVYFPIGRKIRETLLHKDYKLGFEGNSNMDHLVDKPSFAKSAEAITYFHSLFESGALQQIIIVYTHFRTVGTQEVTHIPLLPYKVNTNAKRQSFIVEPSPEELKHELLERSLRAAFHNIIMNSLTSEYAARTIAMQMASENANKLLTELQVTYNKLRQQNITSELLDIVGNSFA